MERMTDYWCPLTSAFVVVRRAPEAPVLITNPRSTYIDHITVIDLEDARRNWTEALGAFLPPGAGNETTRKETQMDMNVGQCAGQAEGPANVITKGLADEARPEDPGASGALYRGQRQIRDLEDAVRRLRESLRRREYDYDEACRTIARQDGIIASLQGSLRAVRNAANVAK